MYPYLTCHILCTFFKFQQVAQGPNQCQKQTTFSKYEDTDGQHTVVSSQLQFSFLRNFINDEDLQS